MVNRDESPEVLAALREAVRRLDDADTMHMLDQMRERFAENELDASEISICAGEDVVPVATRWAHERGVVVHIREWIGGKEHTILPHHG